MTIDRFLSRGRSAALLLLLALFSGRSVSAAGRPQPASGDGGKVRPRTYANPVCPMSLPDPTVIEEEGTYYLYATENTSNVPIMRSQDLVNWTLCGTVFTDLTHPDFVEGGRGWAPDVNRIGDRYVMYYAVSVWGGEWTCGIGVAEAETPEGPWTNRGKLFLSSEIGVQNSIDPFYIEDEGRKYLFWGSFRGLYGIELSDDGLSVRPGAEKRRVAGTAYEAIYIHKRAGRYYLFASVGTCCEGVKSTYTTVVGRSDSLFGPYLDRQGRSMLENRHEVVVTGSGRFAGPGHNAEIVTDARGRDWMLYHAVDVRDPKGRALMLDRIRWRGGWPEVKDRHPSERAAAPRFR